MALSSSWMCVWCSCVCRLCSASSSWKRRSFVCSRVFSFSTISLELSGTLLRRAAVNSCETWDTVTPITKYTHTHSFCLLNWCLQILFLIIWNSHTGIVKYKDAFLIFHSGCTVLQPTESEYPVKLFQSEVNTLQYTFTVHILHVWGVHYYWNPALLHSLTNVSLFLDLGNTRLTLKQQTIKSSCT